MLGRKKQILIGTNPKIQTHKTHCLMLSIQRRQWQPTPVLLPGKSHGWRSLVGYSSWGTQYKKKNPLEPNFKNEQKS